ncbi:MAG: C-terminal helicase domain-containing protein, partial [Miltoncostaeaceae bacterium]
RFLPVAHEGNDRSSPEEAAVIADRVSELLASDYESDDAEAARLTPDDIMVVAPYNAQVDRLRRALPDRVRVGTVDKFQGQEAPVVFFSMTTSSGEDVPRNLAFLLSLNRLNVAVSRARALAIVVASPELLSVRCRSLGDMRLASALCLLAEIAESQTRGSEHDDEAVGQLSLLLDAGLDGP